MEHAVSRLLCNENENWMSTQTGDRNEKKNWNRYYTIIVFVIYLFRRNVLDRMVRALADYMQLDSHR